MELASATLLSLILLIMVLSVVLMIVIPVLPGQLGIWLAAMVYGLATRWEQFGLIAFLILTVLTLASLIIDQVAGWWGAKRGGASFRGLVAAWIVGLIGAIFLNAFGAILGFLLGLIGYEYWRKRDWQHSWTAAKGYLLGQILSLATRLLIAFLMIGIFWFQVR